MEIINLWTICAIVNMIIMFKATAELIKHEGRVFNLNAAMIVLGVLYFVFAPAVLLLQTIPYTIAVVRERIRRVLIHIKIARLTWKLRKIQRQLDRINRL